MLTPSTIPYTQKGYFRLFSKLPSGLWVFRKSVPVIPDRQTQLYFLRRYHSDNGHFGFLKTLTSIKKHAYWKSMDKDVKAFVASCDECQHTNPSPNTPGLLHSLPIPDRRCHSIHLDFASMPNSGGHNFLLVIIDRFSKFISAVPLGFFRVF